MKRRIVFILPIILLLAVAACSSAPDEPIVVTDAWVRPAPAGQNSAIYFQIDNPSSSSRQPVECIHQRRPGN